jgi:murein L,D-transpeptidase YcbB/YkuD
LLLTLAVAALAAAPAMAEKNERASPPADRTEAPAAAPAPTAPVAARLPILLASALPADITAEERAALNKFYAGQNHRPVWVGEGQVTQAGAVALRRLLSLAESGAVDLGALDEALAARRGERSPAALAELELLIGAALVRAALDPRDPLRPGPRPQVLASAAAAPALARFLDIWLPPDPGFWRLRRAVGDYRALVAAGGWPEVQPGPRLEPGMAGPRVEQLRRRLLASGDLAASAGSAGGFDDALAEALIRFQNRHGLEADGVAGKDTIAALNLSAAARLAQLEANLRRRHGEARDWGRRYLAVNVAAARYRLVEDGRPVFDAVAIVGLPTWPTPLLSSEIGRLELNPYWTVPPRIEAEEIGPAIAADPNYMASHNMEWFGGMIRQRPGPGNALGAVKFLFDNPHSVYLHDTNQPKLFGRAERHLSHGCIRLPNARELAAWLLKDRPDWPRERIDEVIRSRRNTPVALPRPLPIHLHYDTAWVDEDGTVQFRPDLYGRDSGTPVAEIKEGSV